MDVKCEKCATEYEFDDAKVTESGIMVKCTQCGHLFRVVRHSVALDGLSEGLGQRVLTPPPKPEHWKIRERDGAIRTFKDLVTLQRWIEDGKISRTDEISKSGESWKPLGTIVELAGFFPEAPLAPLSSPPPSAAPPLTPSPGPAPPPPRSDADLLDTGEFSLEVSEEEAIVRQPAVPPPPPALTPAPTASAAAPAAAPLGASGYGAGFQDQGAQYQGAPYQGAAHQGTPPPQYTGQNPGWGPPSAQMLTLHHSNTGIPVLRTPSGETLTFDGETPAYVGRPPSQVSGFLIGVLASVALAGVGYFLYDQFYGSGDAERPPIEEISAEALGAKPSEASAVERSKVAPAVKPEAAKTLIKTTATVAEQPAVPALKAAAVPAPKGAVVPAPKGAVVPAPKAITAPAPETEAPAPQPGVKPVAAAAAPKQASTPRAMGFDALMKRADAALERGRAAQARPLYKRAARQRPSSPEPLADLGWCDLEQGRHSSALSNFKRALSKSSRYADAMYGIAVAYERSGAKAQAITAYEAFLVKHPRGRRVKMVKRKLERLR